MSEASRLRTVLDALAGGHTLVVGDVMLDRFVSGSVDRISPEAPIPVMQITSEEEVLGGAGNVVRNIVALGGAATFVTVVGDDAPSHRIAELLADEPRVTVKLAVEPGRPATVKTRYFAGGQQLLRADQETSAPVSDTSMARALAAFDGALVDADVIVLSDYAKGVLTEDMVRTLIERGRAAGKPVLVDPKSRDFSRYRGATLVTPNERELAMATHLPAKTESEVEAAAREVLAHSGIAAVLVTRSSRGMAIVDADRVRHIPVKARAVFDVSGAGDTVIATVAAALAAGGSLDEAALLANNAASIVVGKVGTAVAYLAEILLVLEDRDLAASETKIATREAARDRVRGWRRTGARVGFTNGCFDLLHPGHVSLLEQARAHCDRLVVGVNSDASVHRLKGPDRPIQSERERALMLGSHGVVDLVVVFDEDTPLELIRELRPDALVKGADYTVDTVVGADVVRGYGGQVHLAALKPGYSTTNTIAKLRKAGGA